MSCSVISFQYKRTAVLLFRAGDREREGALGESLMSLKESMTIFVHKNSSTPMRTAQFVGVVEAR